MDTKKKKYHCAVEATLSIIGGKWKAVILWHLRTKIRRFNEIKKRIPGITPKMLSQQLKELESDGLIERNVIPEIPPKVEYYLTEKGKTLRPIIQAMCDWGLNNLEHLIDFPFEKEKTKCIE